MSHLPSHSELFTNKVHGPTLELTVKQMEPKAELPLRASEFWTHQKTYKRIGKVVKKRCHR